MRDRLISSISEIKSNRAITGFGKTAIKQAVK